MKAVLNLRTLGLTAVLVSPIWLPSAAVAQLQTYYHAGVWDAFSGRNDKGGAVCGIGNTNPANSRRFSIRRDIGAAEAVFSVSKPDWTIPDNTRVTVVIQIGLSTPWTQQAVGGGHSIDWRLDPGVTQAFDQQFRTASSMTVTFPDGNEPSWAIALAGSSAISDAFGRCVRDLTRQVQAVQQQGATPVPQGPTQPFSPPAGPSPVDAPPEATQPTATQPVR